MRDIVLVLATLGFLPLCVRYPAAGAICWTWFSIMNPHRQLYGFAAGQQFNLVIAVATLVGWLLSAERKRWTGDFTPRLLLIFVVWMTFNSFFAALPDYSWTYWDRTMRSLALVFLAFVLFRTKPRIHGLVWILVISIGYYAVKGGIFTLITGGSYIVYGPPFTIIEDNNQLALAVVMTLPLLNYLILHSAEPVLRLGLMVAFFVEVGMIIGSHSRGGWIALAAVLVLLWSKTHHKLVSGLIGIAIIGAVLSVMPETFWNRLDTITDAQNDSSFQSRLSAWWVAAQIAVDRFPFGAGFYAQQIPAVYHIYLPSERPHAAHSIYFQVLGEHGFIGLAFYVTLLVLAFRNAGIVLRQTRGRSEFLWAYDLVRMIRISIIGYCIGGAALSMAYFDGFLLILTVASSLRELTAAERSRAETPILSPETEKI